MEKWETISNYTDYEVSDTGNIRKKIQLFCITGHKFLVANKNGYDMIGETEHEIIEKYERLGV